MATGIISLLNSFGVEIGKFTSTGVYGLSVLAIFIGLWIVLYHFMSKKGENKTPMSKGLPPIISFALTIALIADVSGGSVGLKSHTEFLKMFLGFFGFLITLVLSSLLLWVGIISNKKLNNSWGHLILATTIFIASNALLVHFDPELVGGIVAISSDGSMFAAFYFKESFIGKTFGESLDVIGDVLNLVNVLSLFGIFWFLFKGIGSLGLGGASKGVKWVSNIRSERKENIKTLDDSVRRIEILMKQGSEIYENVSKIVKDKKEIVPQTSEWLKNWKVVVTKLDLELKKIEKVNSSKLKYRVRRTKTTFDDIETLQLGIQNLFRLVETMETQIDSALTNMKKEDIYSQLYNIAMSWYNFATGYVEVDKKVKKTANKFKEELELAGRVFDKEEELIRLQLKNLKLKGANKEFNFAVKKAINELFAEDEKTNKIRKLRVCESIFRSMSEFITNENYKQLNELKLTQSKENNLFVHLYNFIWKAFEAEYNKNVNVEVEETFEAFVQRYYGPNQIADLLLKSVGTANTQKQTNENNAKAQELEALFIKLKKKDTVIQNLIDSLHDKSFSQDLVSKIYDQISLEFKEIKTLFAQIQKIDVKSLNGKVFDDIKSYEDFIKSLEVFKGMFFGILEDLQDSLDGMKTASTFTPSYRKKLVERLTALQNIIDKGNFNEVNSILIKALNK